MNHRQVIENFAKGKRAGKGHNVFIEGNTLYSYGHHFPLAVRRRDGVVLLNGDKYSITTSHHQSMTFSEFEDSPRVAFSAIRAAGLDPETPIVDFKPDFYENRYPGNENWDAPVPPGASLYRRTVDGVEVVRDIHRVGTVLMRNGSDYLCSMDEGSYFVSKLLKRADSVDEAFQALKPEDVLQAEAKGLEVKRQGEWYFIPIDTTPRPEFWKRLIEWDMKPKFELPRPTTSANIHICNRGINYKGLLIVTGSVRHIDPWHYNPTGEHKTVRLDTAPYTKLFEAVHNLTAGNWSASGRVD